MKKNDYKIRILVTGGSGFIGTNAIDYLIGKNIPCLNIDFHSPRTKTHREYWVDVDIRDYTKLKKEILTFKPTHILHLAAATGMEVKNLSFFSANIEGVENIVRLSKEVATLRHIVFTSSLLVCRNGYIPESDTDYCPPNLYGQSKMLGEKIVRECDDLGCSWSIVRPTSIWGPWFEYSYKAFFKMIDNNRYMHIGKNEFQKPACFVGNTIYMLMKILLENDPKINKSTYYLADYPWYSTKEWANTIQKILNSKPIKTAPIWFLRLVAFFGNIIKRIFKFDPPLTSFRLNNMLTGGEYPIENTKQICGKLPYNLKEAVFITSQWMFENNLIKHKPGKI